MKPCPFCGSSRLRVVECDEDDTHYIECEDCLARGPRAVPKRFEAYVEDSRSNIAAARIAWDERVEQGK